MTLDARFGCRNMATRNGTFKVNSKSYNHTSTIYGSWMPRAMFFSGGQAVHYSSDFRARGWLDQLARLDNRLRAWTGNSAQIIDLAPATLGQMARDADSLVDSWRADDIPVQGERLLDLIRQLR